MIIVFLSGDEINKSLEAPLKLLRFGGRDITHNTLPDRMSDSV